MAADDPDHVTVERTGGVGRVVMDRPETNNAMDPRMARQVRDATMDLVEDDDVRCLVLTGTAGAFNTGADLTALAGDSSDGRRLRTIATRLHTTVAHLAGAPKPTITAVSGVAAGGGFGLALSGDLVVMADGARLEFAYPRIGLSGDGGSTYFLPHLVGYRRAREIALLDEPIGAERAVECGLATEAVPEEAFDDRVAELAADLADGPTRAQAEVKRLLDRQGDLHSQMAAEVDSLARLARTGDYARGHAAFLAGEPADFEGQ